MAHRTAMGDNAVYQAQNLALSVKDFCCCFKASDKLAFTVLCKQAVLLQTSIRLLGTQWRQLRASPRAPTSSPVPESCRSVVFSRNSRASMHT